MKNLMFAIFAAATLVACSEEVTPAEETVVEETVVEEAPVESTEVVDDVVDGPSQEVKPEVE